MLKRKPQTDEAIIQPPNVGEMIGAYRLDALIARGGMGIVYAATHVKLGRRAAVKILVDELAMNNAYVERFFQEARVVNEVRHPHIVDVYDFIETDNPRRVAFVMELLDGVALSSLIRGRKLSPIQCVHVALELAAALEAVHAIGVVHRDLKPDNVMVLHGPDGTVPALPQIKVLDFGIAKSLNPMNGCRTAPGAIIGTPAYAAPEQLANGDSTAASDVYALGVILFELLSGRRLYTGEVAAIIRHKLMGTQEPLELPADVPHRDAFVTFINACMHNNPGQRLTLREVRVSLEALGAVIGGRNTARPPIMTPRPKTVARAMQTPVVSPPPKAHTSIQSLEAALVRRPKLAMSLGVAFIAAATLIIASATRAHSEPPVIIEPIAAAAQILEEPQPAPDPVAVASAREEAPKTIERVSRPRRAPRSVATDETRPEELELEWGEDEPVDLDFSPAEPLPEGSLPRW